MATIRKRKTHSGKPTYQVQIRRHGQPRQCRTFSDLNTARLWARQTEAEADRGTLPDLGKLRSTTVRQIAERYEKEICPSLADTAKFAIRVLLRDQVADKALSTVTVTEFAEYRDRRSQSVASVSVNRELGVIRNMFNVARRWGYRIENPIAGLIISGADKPREVRLLPADESKLLAALKSESEAACAVARFALETGMRRGEILNVRKRDILWQEPALVIPETKTGHARTIVLTNTAALILSVLCEEAESKDALLFSINKDQLRRAFHRARVKAGLLDLHFHDLRHERASRFFEQGLTVPEVALMLGHRTYRMLARYTHPQRAIIAEKLKDMPTLRLVHSA